MDVYLIRSIEYSSSDEDMIIGIASSIINAKQVIKDYSNQYNNNNLFETREEALAAIKVDRSEGNPDEYELYRVYIWNEEESAYFLYYFHPTETIDNFDECEDGCLDIKKYAIDKHYRGW